MNRTIALFSGQGAQYVGMGKDLYENVKEAKEVYQCGSDILGFDLAALSFTGVEEELNKTLYSQPAILAHSLAAYESSLHFMEKPSAVAGHSLGEFAALYAGGAYSLEDAFRIIGARAKAMDKAASVAKGAMVAILRSDYDTVLAACKEAGGVVFPVNLNTPDQTVISGEEEAVVAASEIITAGNKRVRAMRLGVASAFHTTMMEPAASALTEALVEITFHPTAIPFYSNVTGDLLEITDYPAYFARHMVSPVNFVGEVASITRDGIAKAVEFGPKKVVAGLVQKNNREIAIANVETAEDIKKLDTF